MIFNKINSRKFNQQARIGGLRMIFARVWSAEIIITLFCDSISFNNIIIICLKN